VGKGSQPLAEPSVPEDCLLAVMQKDWIWDSPQLQEQEASQKGRRYPPRGQRRHDLLQQSQP